MEISLTELKTVLGLTPTAPSSPERDLGQRIVVLDRGFVYVGDVHEQPDRILVLNAKNIRVWGTSKGLGELRDGPLKDTKLDAVGTVEAYRHAVIHMIPCKGF